MNRMIYCQADDASFIERLTAWCNNQGLRIYCGENGSPDVLAVPCSFMIIDRRALGEKIWHWFLAYLTESADSPPCIALGIQPEEVTRFKNIITLNVTSDDSFETIVDHILKTTMLLPEDSASRSNYEDSGRVTGEITNMETGETWDVEHFLLPNDARISAMVRIEQAVSYVHEDGSMQIVVACMALDSIGGVFPLALNFTPKSVTLRDEIVADLQPDRLFYVSGEFTTGGDEILVHDPEYHPVETELVANTLEAFRVNSRWSNGSNE